jgi:Brp/Blh family beta-carotene 15,15'-monooxygenase
MAAVAAVWLVAPGIALGLFLVYTGWHFGETDMGVFGLRISPWQTFLYGFGLIIWILAMHMPETLSFLADLAIFSPTGKVNSLLTSGQTLIKAGAFGCMVAGFIGTEIGQKPLVFLLVALVVATTAFLPLLVGFAAYFGFWHSLHSMHVIKADLQTSYAKLLRQALPYLLVSVVGTGALVGVLEYFHLNAVLVLFIFISALTAPHAQVMHGAFRRLAQRQWPEAQV